MSLFILLIPLLFSRDLRSHWLVPRTILDPMTILPTLETRGSRCATYTPCTSTAIALLFLPLIFLTIRLFIRLMLFFPHFPFIRGVICAISTSTVATNFHIQCTEVFTYQPWWSRDELYEWRFDQLQCLITRFYTTLWSACPICKRFWRCYCTSLGWTWMLGLVNNPSEVQ